MKLIEADQNRFLQIPGLPGPTRRPVDIDNSTTGFASLRSLRIYRFDAGSEINGHAEEDEVFVLVLAGSVEFTASDDNSREGPRTFTLSAAENSGAEACLAYLPPHAAYRLVPKTDADVAYARATPLNGPPAAVFKPQGSIDASGVTVVLDEAQYARRLRLRLLRVTAGGQDLTFEPIPESEAGREALVHVRTADGAKPVTITDANGKSVQLKSWNTAAIDAETRINMQVVAHSSVLILIVSAH